MDGLVPETNAYIGNGMRDGIKLGAVMEEGGKADAIIAISRAYSYYSGVSFQLYGIDQYLNAQSTAARTPST